MSTQRRLGFCVERLRRIDGFLRDRYIAPGRLPCAHLLITRCGEPVHQSVLGFQSVERRVALPENALFRIYSMTKPITSVALMSLVEDGLVSLDDPLSKHLPEWGAPDVFKSGELGFFATVPAERPVQVIDLLRHTSGLTYGFQHRSGVDAAYRELGVGDVYGKLSLAETVGALARLPLDFNPGEVWTYSIATDVIGYLIETITGETLDRVLRKRVFEPLQMLDTSFVVPADRIGRLTSSYAMSQNGAMQLRDDSLSSPCLRAPAFLSGGGGLVATASDYCRFANMLLNHGELGNARILAPKTVQLMTANHLPGGVELSRLARSAFAESNYAGLGFGLGFAVVVNPARTLLPCSMGEFHWGGSASTVFWVDPVEKITVTFMTQLTPSSAHPVRRELRTLIYASLLDAHV